ncbi:hypothetical protein KC878_02450 [Candidatus Saccharibacteria bacterium]|nr:hypothetical protein [Candidatus Saccharibacteria bacterium]MCB9821360.1 hypothetical protein [Candidatus Nomurabacteria bacterium]
MKLINIRFFTKNSEPRTQNSLAAGVCGAFPVDLKTTYEELDWFFLARKLQGDVDWLLRLSPTAKKIKLALKQTQSAGLCLAAGVCGA